MYRSIFIVFALLCILQQNFATMNNNVTKPRNFIQAIASAYSTNPGMHEAIHKLFQQAEAVPDAKGGYLPNVELTANASDSKKTTKNGATSSISNDKNNNIGIVAKQNLFKGFATYNSIMKAKLNVAAAKMELKAKEQEIILQAIKIYIDLWEAYEVDQLKQTSLNFHKRNFVEVKTQAEIGEKNPIDVAEAESKLAAANVYKNESKAAVLAAQAKYLQVIGIKALAADKIDKPYFIISPLKLPQTLNILKEKVMNGNPQLINASFAAKAESLSPNLARSNLSPSVDFSLSVTRVQHANINANIPQKVVSSKRYSNEGVAAMKVTVPIFQQGKDWSAIRKATQSKFSQISALRKTRLELEQVSTQLWYEWQAIANSVKQVVTQVKAAKIEMEGKEHEYLVGEIPLTFVLEAEQKWVQAKTNQIEIHKKFVYKFYQILSIYGQLLVEKLKIPVQTYKVDQYIDDISNKFFGIGSKQSVLER